MEGNIVNFRRGKRTVHHYQMIVRINGISNKEKAQAAAGKTVIWTSPAGKELKGKVSAPHGRNGQVRAIFETGMPGQAIGGKVKIV